MNSSNTGLIKSRSFRHLNIKQSRVKEFEINLATQIQENSSIKITEQQLEQISPEKLKERKLKIKELQAKEEGKNKIKHLVTKATRIRNFKENLASFEITKNDFFKNLFTLENINIKCLKISYIYNKIYLGLSSAIINM